MVVEKKTKDGTVVIIVDGYVVGKILPNGSVK